MTSFSNDLACHDLVELVNDYLENALSTPERARFDAHLDTCPGCREYLAQMRQTIVVLGRLPADSIEPGMRAQLLQVFREWKRGR